MAVVHGSWLVKSQGACLFVWGETWRSRNVFADESLTPSIKDESQVPSHPFAMTGKELTDFLDKHHLASNKFVKVLDSRWQYQAIALPTQPAHKDEPARPVLSFQMPSDPKGLKSIELKPWQVEGLCLEPLEATNFLQALPLGSFQVADYIGADLRFWSQIYRWSLELLARCKFLPTLDRGNASAFARWQPLLDSTTDQARLEKFARQMPAACRTYLVVENSLDFPTPQELLLDFLGRTIEAQTRAWAGSHSLSSLKELLIRNWLQALVTNSNSVEADSVARSRLEALLQSWISPLKNYLVTPGAKSLGLNLFRTCFVLKPPQSGEENWKLEYCLQAADDAQFLVDAATIWRQATERLVYKGRHIDHPQENFLKGLGLAARIYPPIEPSLHNARPAACILTPIQAYEFIRAAIWRLQDSGLGVVLPASLSPEKAVNNRLGLKISADVDGKKARLGLQSLLKFNFQLSIGGQTVSEAEFKRLLAQRTPIVEVNGEWVALQPADVRAAEAVLAKPKDQLSLSVEDALRLATGDTKSIEKLPVVNFEASGVLQELINNLTNNQAIAPIPIPASFKGELRPYQERGVAWLAFLERWGLGACLADDMGLGKCVSKDTLLYVNGNLIKAETIWQTYAGETKFDGEGFWATPTESLQVNSIAEETGKIALAQIRRLYRQRVKEKLRSIKLKDGNSITITYRHQLLTRDGWKNNLKVGDYVCVPANMVWQGQLEDHELIKFLAWQIAEGYEQQDNAIATITQKDKEVLDNLLQTFQVISQRYNFGINRLVVLPNQKNCYYLYINSPAYRRFLEAKGYEWGMRSRYKSIPPFIMQADLDSIRIFLRNYFDAEGSVIHTMRSIEVATASPVIIQQLSVLLRRFGIWMRIAEKQKCASNGTRILRTYYIGTIGGNSARRFLQEIGFGNTIKQQKLEKICEFVSNTNVEGIPASDLVAQIIQSTKLPLRHFGMHNTVYINGSQQFSRASLEKVVVGFDSILSGEAEQKYRQIKPSKWTTQTLEAYAQLDTAQLNLVRKSLQTLLDNEVFYCQIESIEDIDYEGWVYDFEVSNHHNFVANNILCHNTIQTIAFLLHLKEQEDLEQPTLLVCPTSVLGNWEREVKKFGPTLKTVVHHGDKRSKGKDFVKAVKGKDLIITSYPLAFRDVKTIESISWQGLILDEAQNIKNPEAKQSKIVRQLKADFHIALTGTPVENRLQELWSILDFLNPGYLGNRQFFQRRFAVPIEKYGDTDSLKTLRSLVQPFILRRLKTDRDIIQDLPEKQEMNIFCGLTPEQAVLYQKAVDESLPSIDEAEGIERHGKILTLLLRLKQICNHPALYLKENKLASQRSGKLQRLEEMLEEVLEEGDRALIFTQFAEWGKLLQPYLEKQLGWETLFLYGSTRKQQREEMIDRFQNDPQGPRIFILSLKAGGTGLNLTRANHVFHYDRWWNPAVENQATDRVFRIGQTRNVQVHKFVCSGTLEERINELIESKKSLAEQTVDAGEQWLTELDSDQLRNLLLLDRSAVIDEED